MNIYTKQRGIGLIEVMVALTLLSIGVLGMAALQATGLRANNSAYVNSQAALLAYDIYDRMRANPDGNYVIAMATAPPAQDCRGTAQDCSADQMAQYDLGMWKCRLGNWDGVVPCSDRNIVGEMTAGDGSLAIDAGGMVTITVQWYDQTAAAIQDFVFSARL